MGSLLHLHPISCESSVRGPGTVKMPFRATGLVEVLGLIDDDRVVACLDHVDCTAQQVRGLRHPDLMLLPNARGRPEPDLRLAAELVAEHQGTVLRMLVLESNPPHRDQTAQGISSSIAPLRQRATASAGASPAAAISASRPGTIGSAPPSCSDSRTAPHLAMPEVRVEHAVPNHRLDRGPVSKRPGEADERPLEERRLPRGIERHRSRISASSRASAKGYVVI